MISKQRYLMASAIALAIVFATKPAQAQGIAGYGITDFDGGSAVTIGSDVTSLSDHTAAGPFTTYFNLSNPNATRNSAGTTSFETYCIDIYHTNNGGGTGGFSGTNNSNFSKVNLITTSSFTSDRDTGTGHTSPYELAGLGRAAWFANNQSTLALLTGGVIDKAALQIAIWKSEYETQSANFNVLGSGVITFSGLNGTVSGDASAYLNASLVGPINNKSFSNSTAIWVSYRDGSQDQLLDPQFSPVPEPATLTMSGMALIMGCGVAFRRYRNRTAGQI